jgi:hypothetical protein
MGNDLRHRPLLSDLGLRVAGAASLLLGMLAIRHLARLAPSVPAPAASAPTFLLATVGFLLLSGGATLLALGRHIGDQVAVSSRWHRQAQASRPPPPANPAMPATEDSGPPAIPHRHAVGCGASPSPPPS